MIYSIIIINYKTKELTAECIQSLFKQIKTIKFEIIVIDNASGDGSVKFLQEKFGDTIKLITNENNLGFAGANNQGAALAKGDIFLFLNSDTIIEKNFFHDYSDILKQNKQIGIISPRLLTASGENQKSAFGRFPNIFRLITQKTKIDPILDENKKYNIVDWVSGCALIIRRDLFEQIKGWDEKFFLYYEDVDLCKRVKNCGYLSAVANKTTIIHLGGQSLAQSLKKHRHYFRSQDYYFRKHYGFITSLILKLARLPYELIIIIKSVKK
ncbi:MAG: glycosyltransferase family 2 protein [Patescibacteria group bacterium]|nr:glycosyltransferase family 2 protein [Patescibacteria group bacterium]